MAKNLRLTKADKLKVKITKVQQKQIIELYNNLANEIQKRINSVGTNDLQKRELMILKRDIEERLESIGNDIQNGIVRGMNEICAEVAEDTKDFLKTCGYADSTLKEAFVHIPSYVTESIITGKIYDKKWYLSKAIWGNNKKIMQNINGIVAQGVAKGYSAKDIAKNIEQYVRPSVKRQANNIHSWRYNENGEKIKDTFYNGKIEYNSIRLARTLVSHAYQQSFERVNEYNPFVIGYKWLTSNFHGRVCEVCRDRATQDRYGLGAGVFPKDELPIDHPNGMCTFEAVLSTDMKEVAQRINNWYRSPIGTDMELDRFAEFMENGE